MSVLTCGSLFSGVGGMDLGLTRAGFRHEFFAESDEWRRGILARHWPGVPIHDDVRAVGQGAPAVDLLAGGFPCQDLSIAGKRAGLAGDRSGLFFEFARITDELRPRWLLINQAALGDDKAVLTRKLRRAIHSEATGVRRLTPTECERLMSWPDGWTLPGSDSRRYAACGDGVVANVAEWIGLGIKRESEAGS